MTKGGETEVVAVDAEPEKVAQEEVTESANSPTPASVAEIPPTTNGPAVAANAAGAQLPASKKGKTIIHKADFEKGTVYLYQFSRFPTLPSASPFCLKVETWLRMTGLKYENVDHKLKFKSKKGQLPFIEVNGEEIADSDIIIKELGKMFDKDLDRDLSPDQRNVSHAFISMLNNHTSWVVRWWRYSHPGQFLKTAQVDIKRTLNSKLPKGLLQFVFKLSLKSNVKQAVSHGLGRHTSEEIIEFGKNDLKALSDVLGEKTYFFGDEPHLLDCVAFAHLCQFLYVPFGGLKEFIEMDCANLARFVDTIKETHWPDWEEMCKTLDLNTHLPKKEEKPAVAANEDDHKKEKEDEKEKGEKGEDEKETKKEAEEVKEKSEPEEEKDKDTLDNKEVEEKVDKDSPKE